VLTDRRFETLPDKVFEVGIGLLKEKEGNCVYLAAHRLEPFVESILNGTDCPPAITFESVGIDGL
jgi:hypothetical protein